MTMLFGAPRTNLNPTQAVYAFLQTALAAGCTVTSSGDGLALFSTVGNILTKAGSGAGGLGNTRAYFVLNLGGEQWCWQRNSDVSWNLCVSRTATMSGGVPSATVRPTAPDEIFIAGGGTAATPVYQNLFDSSECYSFWGVDDTAPRRFYLGRYLVSGVSFRNLVFRDVVVVSESSDADPYARGQIYVTITSSSWAPTGGGPTTNTYFQVYVPSVTPTTAISCPLGTEAYIGTGTSALPGNATNSPIDGADILMAPYYFRANSTGTPINKGWSTLFLVPGPNRSNTTTYQVVTPRDRIVMGGLSLPYGGNIPPV